jgi:hypothetical protein
MDLAHMRGPHLHVPRHPVDLYRVLLSAIGVGAILLWAWTGYVHQSAWSFWLDGLAAGLAFIAVAMFQTTELFAIPVLTVTSMLYFAIAFFGGSTGFSRWLVAWHIVFAVMFLLLVPLSVLLHDPVPEGRADDAARA